MSNSKLTFEQLRQLIVNAFSPEVIVGEKAEGFQPYLIIQPSSIAAVCSFLHTNDQCYFDYLANLTGIDNGPGQGTMEVVYHLNSIPYEHTLVLKVVIAREKPEVSTISNIWATANWHEREAFDLIGINFTGHPDLRRILLPNDWEGHPLQKDYQEQERYHGIQVKY